MQFHMHANVPNFSTCYREYFILIKYLHKIFYTYIRNIYYADISLTAYIIIVVKKIIKHGFQQLYAVFCRIMM